jgi:murein L,D-transpeptidase YcbB/YkuD
VRLQLDETTLSQSVTVKPDPRDSWTTADLQSAYDFAEKYNVRYGKIDDALNNLDAIKKSLDKADASDSKIAAAKAQWQDVFSTLTANFKNGEDSIQHPSSLREEIPRSGFGSVAPPTAAQLDYAARWDALYDTALTKYNDYVKSLAGMNIDGAKTVTP